MDGNLSQPLREALAQLQADGTQLARTDEGRFLLARCAAKEPGALERALPKLWARLREMTAQPAVRALGVEHGFRLEDVVYVELHSEQDPSGAWQWMARQLPEKLQTQWRSGPTALALVFRERTGPPPARPEYALRPDGRVHVEAFELHVVEHCNLRCANCCNMSPFVANKTLSVEGTRAQLRQMAEVLYADVFKIMGGEPLLHPDIAGVLRAVRESGISPIVRLFTNGLALHTMSDEFWRSLDQLTISNYDSAPVKPRILALAEQKAAELGFILNTKPVSTFSQVLSPRYEADDAKVSKTFAQCWLRHRCLIARNGHFYTCTKAAYARDFHERIKRDEPPPGYVLENDGVPLQGENLASRLVEYLNRSSPLASCRYCYGGDGKVERHTQLTAAMVREGRLSPDV